VVVVTDLWVHPDDVAAALGLRPRRGSAASAVALAGYCFGVDYRIDALGLPVLTLRYQGRERTHASGPVAATVTGDRTELLPVLAGRRTRSQILTLDWLGDPEPWWTRCPRRGANRPPVETG